MYPMYTKEELETMQLLPKHTRVQITGNQRTKSTQNGLEGVVKKSTGLGGWLCVLLSSGETINVQRNGVVVLEAPTGDEAVRAQAGIASVSLADLGRKLMTICNAGLPG